MKFCPCATQFITAIAFVAASAGAQTTGVITAGAGTATDTRGISSNALTLSPGLSILLGAKSSAYLGATGVRFGNNGWQLGADGALAAETESGHGFALTFNGSATMSKTSFDAAFAQADGTPALTWTTGPLTFVGGAHVATGYADVHTTAAPAVPLTGNTLTTVSRSAVAPSYGATLRFDGDATSAILLSYRAEPTRVGSVLVRDQTVSTTLFLSGLQLSAIGGQRRATDESLDYVSGSAAIPVTGSLTLNVAGGSYPSNRLTGATGGKFFSTGISLRIGGPRGVPSMPQPSAVAPPAAHTTRLAIRAPNASRVEIAGDWNGWTPVAATRAPNGVWYADVPLEPGEYRYAFRVDATDWRVPEGAVAVDDGFGGKAAYVTVREAVDMQAKHNKEEE